MPGSTIKISSSGGTGGEFDCYLALPAGGEPAAAVVLAAAAHGADRDLCDLADEFAARGYIAAAPDLYWRTIPGPLTRADKELTAQRTLPRLEKIKTGEADMTDTLAYVRGLPGCNGRVAAMGFCHGGPYAILGPRRLGYDAGIACHGTNMLAYIGELDGLTAPLCIIWGDRDHAAPPDVLDAFGGVPARMSNVEVHIFPGIAHGYMMPDAGPAYDRTTREFSMARALAILGDLSGGGANMRKAS